MRSANHLNGMAEGSMDGDLTPMMRQYHQLKARFSVPGDANNYLVALAPAPDAWGLAAVDLSTGEVQVTELRSERRDAQVAEELTRWNPREALIPENDLSPRGSPRAKLSSGRRRSRKNCWKTAWTRAPRGSSSRSRVRAPL